MDWIHRKERVLSRLQRLRSKGKFAHQQFSDQSEHELALRQCLSDAPHFSGNEPAIKQPLYVLAFYNRSGSNLLGAHLRATGLFCGFREQLNAETIRNTCARTGARTLEDYFKALMKLGECGDRKLFGIKASAEQLVMLNRAGADRLFQGMKVIHIRRNDVLDLAVSYVIAKQTRSWTASGATKGKQADRKVTYDANKIDEAIRASQRSSDMIRLFCRASRTERFNVVYETLCKNPRKTVDDLCHRLNLDPGEWPLQQAMRKQANELNEEFKQRYLADIARRMRSER